ncbi:hypothetical protein PIB30_066768 [Stylosanthes scabra]|uniref:Uncharacterized protein n=1 Tax=Stylosanthes scabra TaxID=79078 RepID=A0ABU6YN69_9FABA|nr:hypothetical protein [Stylosanthes scabra]
MVVPLFLNNPKGIADLTASSSKDLLAKLRNFEMNRAKIAAQRQNYGIQEVSSGAVEDEDKQGQLATKGKNMNVLNVTSAQSKLKEGDFATKGVNQPLTRLKATESDLKDGEFGTKGMHKNDNRAEMGTENKKECIASQNKSKEGPPLPKRIKKSVPKKLDFSFLQRTFDSISRKVNTVAPLTSGEQQNIPPE